MTGPRRWWAEYRADEVGRADWSGAVAILPLAAVEQHGPHLPLGTDLIIAEGMLRTLIALAPPTLDVRILPIQPIGKSNEHLFAPGTLSHAPESLIPAWTQIGLDVARTGIKRILFVTAHGGNEEIMGIVARDLRVRAGMLAVKGSWGRFGYPPGLIGEDEQRLGIHGGEVETALMLHFRPDLVDMGRAENFASGVTQAERDFDLLRPTGPFGYSWIATDINPKGVVGDAARATAQTGRMIAAHQVAGMIRLLTDMGRAPPPAP